MINYITGFMYSTDKEKVALINKLSPAWQRGLINGIGGKMEGDESPSQGMVREFEEETGVKTLESDWKLFTVISRPGKYNVHFLYCISSKITKVRTIEREVVGIFEVDKLPRNVIHNLHWLIPMSLDPSLKFDKPVYLIEERDA